MANFPRKVKKCGKKKSLSVVWDTVHKTLVRWPTKRGGKIERHT